MLLAAFGYSLLPSAAVWANPTGEQVVGGAATFQREGNTLTVNQTTDRLAVNWQDFSIAAGERTHFNMPSATSAALNRVLGGNPSQIYGSLSANGILYLVNPAGILVGPGGTINTAAFIGSTLDIDPQQFMQAGQGMHLGGDSYAPIVNQGSIRAEEGDVFLIAQKVENRGEIFAAKGTAALVGTGRPSERTEVVLHEVGGAGFAVRVAQLEGEAAGGSNHGLPDGEELLNEGTIHAAQVELNASGNIYSLAIKNSGTLRAKGVIAQNDGTVRLDGGIGNVLNSSMIAAKNAGEDAVAAGGKVEISGKNVTAAPESIITAAGGERGGNGGKVKIDSADTTIVQGKVDVTAPSAGAKGGKVELLGEKVGLLDGAKVNASGGAGGGTVLVGGDYLGGSRIDPDLRDRVKAEDASVKNAKATVMAETAEVRADATVQGDGGKIILWSDEYTGFYGELFARGGLEGGNGGFVETSSKNNLQSFGSVAASATHGRSGLWLLDPTDVLITTATANGSFSGTNPNVFTPNGAPAGVAATASVTTINTSLTAGTDVRILTASSDGQTGNITVGALITSAGTGDLALVADGGIRVNTPINITGGVTLTSQTGVISINANITSAAGDVSVTTVGGNIDVNGNITATAGQVRMDSSSAIKIAGTVTTATGITLASQAGMTITAGGALLNTGGAGDIFLSSGAGITNNGVISMLGTVGAGGNVLLDANGGAITGTGVIILEDPALATDSSLGMQASGNISVFVEAPVVAELAPNPTQWTPQDAGPPIAAEAGGTLSISNVGLVGSAIVVGTVNAGIGMISGGTMQLNAGDGNLILGGSSTISGGDFIGRASEPTAGTIFVAPSDRITPAVTSTGTQTYFGLVTLNAYDGMPVGSPVDSPGLTVLRANGFQFRQSINDGSIDGVNILATGRESLLLIESGGGTTEFLDYVGTHRNSPDGFGTVDYLGPLYSFRHENGKINFYAVGTAVSPVLGSTQGPSIYVFDSPTGGTPRLAGAGTATFDSTAITLYENTYITTYGDILFGGTIDGVFKDLAPTLTVETLLYDAAPVGEKVGGQIIFDGDIGSTVGLSTVTAVARGWNLDTDNCIKDSQITTQDIFVFVGTNPPKEADCDIILTADGGVVIAGTLDTRGTTGAPNSQTIAGDISITSDADVDNPLENIQLGTATTEASLLTQGGEILMNKKVFISNSATIDSTLGNPLGAVVFAGTIDLAPGAAFSITSGGQTEIRGDLNGDSTASVSIRIGNGNALVISGKIGADSPIGSFTVGEGSGTVEIGNDIQTAGGAVSFGMKVLMQDDVMIDTTKGVNQGGGNISFLQSVGGDGTSLYNLILNAGANGTIGLAPASGDTSDQPNSAELNTLWVQNAGAFNFTGTITAKGKNASVFDARGWEDASIVLEPTLRASGSAAGSTLTLQAEGDDSGHLLLLNGVFTSFLRSAAANVTLISKKGRAEIRGTVAMDGGSDALGQFGFDGGDLKVFAYDSLVLPDFSATGGRGTFSDGRGGNLIAEVGVASRVGSPVGMTANDQAVISFPTPNFNILEDSFVKLSAGRDIILGVVENPYAPVVAGSVQILGGTVLQLNQGGDGLASTLTSRGGVVFEYGGASDAGSFIAPTSGGILTNGGDVVINRIVSAGGGGGVRGSAVTDPLLEDYDSPAAVIFTTINRLNSGRVFINKEYNNLVANIQSNTDVSFGDVFLTGIFTLGGAPATTSTVGLSGGDIAIHGRDVVVGTINTLGSDSPNAGNNLAIGGSGGNISIESEGAGRQITLRRDLTARGGSGNSTLAGFGGVGGQIDLIGNVVLKSGDSTRTSIIFDTTGGIGSAQGENGFGGDINWSLGTLSGTAANSNTLDLRYGDGTVRLGQTGDTIVLENLITAADAATSLGILRIGGELDLDTLTTYARGYSIEILGGGTVASPTDFLNTGYVQIGDNAPVVSVTEFLGGLNTQNGPSTTVLAGFLQTSREVSDAGLLFGNVELFADTFLNTFGNTLQMGTLNAVDDGAVGTSPGLTLTAEMGNAVINITGSVGGAAGLPSVLNGKTLEAPGTITLETPVDANGDLVARTTPIIFGQTVTAGAIVQETGAYLEFNNDVNLTGTGGVASTFADDVSLINQAYTDDPTAVLTFSSGQSVTFNGAVLLENGPVELSGDGDFALGATGTLDGAQDLILSGAGAKDFSQGIVGGVTPIGAGIGAAITMSGGPVMFGDLETASGLDSTTAPVVFTGVVVLGDGDTATTLDANVTFNGAVFTSTDDVTFGNAPGLDDLELQGSLVLGGKANYTFDGRLFGGFGVTLGGDGQKTFAGTVGVAGAALAGFTQVDGSGLVRFEQNVITSGANTFNGRVVLDGLTFTSGGLTTFGNSSADTLSLSTGLVTLQGGGNYTINATVNGGSQDLTLAGGTTKTFQAGVSGLGTLTISAGTANFNSTLGATALSQAAGTLNLNGNVNLAGASTLGGIVNLAGITFDNSGANTTITGTVNADGNTLMTSALFLLGSATPLNSNGTLLTLNGPVFLGVDATLGGLGAITINGAVSGDQLLTLASGVKTFASTVVVNRITQTAGTAVFGGDVNTVGNSSFLGAVTLDGMTFTSGGSISLNTLTVAADSEINTGSANITIGGTASLNGGLTLNDGGGAAVTSLNTVTGSSSYLTVTTDAIILNGAVSTGSGVVTITKADGAPLSVGTGGSFLSDTDVARITTSGGLTIGTDGAITLFDLASTDTDGITGVFRFTTALGNNIILNPGSSVTIQTFGGLADAIQNVNLLTTGGFNDLTLRAAGLTYTSSGNLSLAGLNLSGNLNILGKGLNVNGGIQTSGRADLAANGGNITVASRIVAPTAITVNSGGGYFVNSIGGNPFTSADTRILTRNLFSTFPANGAVPGLANLFGVTSFAQVNRPNSMGITEGLLQGSAAPYVTEFTTGTGQPYILATQNAVPVVMMPMPIAIAGAFPSRLSYTEEELELLTPEERSAYEAGQRQQAFRVMWERSSGSPDGAEVPSEGAIPQAQVPAPETPAPTAQVYLDGKPLAGQTDRNHRNATQFIRSRPERAFVQKTETPWLEQERMTAEVYVGSLPLAKAK